MLIRNNQQTKYWQAATLLRTSMQTFPWEFSGMSKTITTNVSIGDLSITIKSNLFVRKKYRASFFLKKQKRVIIEFLTHCRQ